MCIFFSVDIYISHLAHHFLVPLCNRQTSLLIVLSPHSYRSRRLRIYPRLSVVAEVSRNIIDTLYDWRTLSH